MKCLAVAVFSIFFLFFSPLKAAALPAEEFQDTADHLPAPFDISAGAYILMEMETGRVLAGQDIHERLAMASTTKIMTCILALENGGEQAVATASAQAAAAPKVHLGVYEGEQFLLGDLLYSLMLESHNDSAVAIAEHLAGSVPQFAGWMNEKAEEIGCTEAHFVTPNGLDGEDVGGVHSCRSGKNHELLCPAFSQSCRISCDHANAGIQLF